jgi:hypothetical protein
LTAVLIVSGVVAALVGLYAFVVTRRPAALALDTLYGGKVPAVAGRVK